MSRHKESRNSGSPIWLLFLVGGLALVFGFAAGGGVGFVVGRASAKVEQIAIAPSAPAAKMTRDQLKKAVEGKTQAEVLAAIGKPDRTDDSGPNAMWTYYDRTRDDLTGRDDKMVFLHFEGGRVRRVGF